MSHSVKIKICGIKDYDTANLSINEGADFIGFNFSHKSKRYISINEASNIINQIHQKLNNYSYKIVALFYENTIEQVTEIMNNAKFDFIQYVVNDSVKINYSKFNFLKLPQIAVEKKLTIENLNDYEDSLIILDSYSSGLGGGSGKTFNWEFIKDINRNYLLAGGLNSKNVGQAIEILHPYGVDVASGVESSPGVKDKNLIHKFIKNVKRF